MTAETYVTGTTIGRRLPSYKARPIAVLCLFLAAATAPVAPARAQEAGGDAGLAQTLTNPVADLVTVPIQMNFDRDFGQADDGKKLTTNV